MPHTKQPHILISITLIIFISSNRINPGIKEEFLSSLYTSPSFYKVLPDKTEYFRQLFLTGIKNDDPKLIKLAQQACYFSTEEEIKLAILYHSHKVLDFLIHSEWSFDTRWVITQRSKTYTFKLDDDIIYDQILIWKSKVQLNKNRQYWFKSDQFISELPINFAIQLKNYTALKQLANFAIQLKQLVDDLPYTSDEKNERAQNSLDFAIEMKDPEAVNILLLSNNYCCPESAAIAIDCPVNISLTKVLESLADPEHSRNKQLIKIVETFINRFGCNMLIYVDNWTTILNYAIKKQLLPIVKLLLKKNDIIVSSQEIQILNKTCKIVSPLSKLLEQPYNNTTELIAHQLLNHYRCNVNEQDPSNGNTLLHVILKTIKYEIDYIVSNYRNNIYRWIVMESLLSLKKLHLWFNFLAQHAEIDTTIKNHAGAMVFDYLVDGLEDLTIKWCYEIFKSYLDIFPDSEYITYNTWHYFIDKQENLFGDSKGLFEDKVPAEYITTFEDDLERLIDNPIDFAPQSKSIEGKVLPHWFFFKQLHYAAIKYSTYKSYRKELLKINAFLQQHHPELFIEWSDAASLYNCDKDDLDHLLDLKVELSSNRIKMQRLLAGYALNRDKNNKLAKFYNCNFYFKKHNIQ